MILGFEDYAPQSKRLAAALGWEWAMVEIHRFPDGESKVTVPATPPEHVVLCRSLDQPAEKLVELMLAAQTLRELGVQRLSLVSPYLCYMRQDMAFHPGEAVSQRVIGQFLGQQFDAVLTVDPHLHRVNDLNQVMPDCRAVSLSATALMSHFLEQLPEAPLILGPDEESAQWVTAIAEPAGLESAVASKQRLGDRAVQVTLPALSYRDRAVVLVDDMVSTGHTLATVTRQLKSAGAHSVHCLVTHALFDHQVSELLKHSGVDNIWSTDSVSHPSNAVQLASLLAGAVDSL